jgi:hypothetical protein
VGHFYPADTLVLASSQFAQNIRYPDADYGGYGGGNIGALMEAICTKAAPEGGTYASQGYCD